MNRLPELHFHDRGNEFYKPAAAFLSHGNSFITKVLSHFFSQQSLLSKRKKTILRQCRELVSLACLWLAFETLQVKHATLWVWYQISPAEKPPPPDCL